MSQARAQYSTIWPATTTANTAAAGYIGIGTKATSTSSTLPNFNLQLHGTTDYTYSVQGVPPLVDINGNIITPGQAGYTANLGKTTRLGLTNSVTGMGAFDGTVIRQSNNDFVIENQETTGNINLKANGVNMLFNATNERIWVGSSASHSSYAEFNVLTTDNGLMIQSLTSNSGYGLRVKMAGTTKNAIEVFSGSGTSTEGTRNFSVTSTGIVYARKYTTTLANIPDYVFSPDYKLLPLGELRNYIHLNSHLPNIPSAKEYAETGVDLGELNRLLLEKTEELTLYILQLEERIKILESTK